MTYTEDTLFTWRGDWTGQVLGSAIHTGHDLRPEVAALMVLPEDDRFREEDPFTDALGSHVEDQVVVHRSRFEVDLNRAPADAVYATPEQSWGMQVWEGETLAEDVVERSLEEHRAFYAALAERLDAVAARGPFLFLDVHSYNHRRTDDHSPEDPQQNPDVNVGTGSLDRDLWAPLVDTFNATLGAQNPQGRPLDVRENVKFKGAELCRWIHERYPGVGCALAIEFKKTYMDEWTGEPDHPRIAALAAALGTAARRCGELLAAGEAQTRPATGAQGPARTPIEKILSHQDVEAERELADISASFAFLTALTPSNAVEAKQAFLSRPEEAPAFEYPGVDADLDALSRRLEAVDLSSVGDQTVRQLLTNKHHELDLQIAMLRARGTRGFLPLSIELFGAISPRLRQRAERILAWVPDPAPATDRIDAHALLDLAEAEIAYYRGQDPGVEMHAVIDDDAAGVMVQADRLLIPPSTRIDTGRANALIQHEVGTHLVTRANGAAQPLRVFAALAGYDETQEGLAVLAEIACGGLTAARLRTLAARVITVHRMVRGASFVECFRLLVDGGFSQGGAFTTVMRVFRSGGFTKDAVYLRGLVDLLDHLAAGGRLDLLYLGKFGLHDLPLVQDLWDRGVLAPARLRPRFLDDPASLGRIERAAHAESLTDIFQKEPTA